MPAARSGELEPERAREETAQPSPVLAGHVPEAVLHEGLLHREVEERLQEAGREDHRRVVAEGPPRVELVRRDDRAEESEGDGRVDADARKRAADEEPAHQARV
jgi:hypothetical protein